MTEVKQTKAEKAEQVRKDEISDFRDSAQHEKFLKDFKIEGVYISKEIHSFDYDTYNKLELSLRNEMDDEDEPIKFKLSNNAIKAYLRNEIRKGRAMIRRKSFIDTKTMKIVTYYEIVSTPERLSEDVSLKNKDKVQELNNFILLYQPYMDEVLSKYFVMEKRE